LPDFRVLKKPSKLQPTNLLLPALPGSRHHYSTRRRPVISRKYSVEFLWGHKPPSESFRAPDPWILAGWTRGCGEDSRDHVGLCWWVLYCWRPMELFTPSSSMTMSIIYFASAAVAVDSSHMTASSSASCPPSNFVNGHVSTNCRKNGEDRTCSSGDVLTDRPRQTRITIAYLASILRPACNRLLVMFYYRRQWSRVTLNCVYSIYSLETRVRLAMSSIDMLILDTSVQLYLCSYLCCLHRFVRCGNACDYCVFTGIYSQVYVFCSVMCGRWQSCGLYWFGKFS